jgi:hypothetical protein
MEEECKKGFPSDSLFSKYKRYRMVSASRLPKHLPPKIEDVKVYFSRKGISDQEAEQFFFFYERKFWKNKKGEFFKSWKMAAYRWINGIKKAQPALVHRHIK